MKNLFLSLGLLIVLFLVYWSWFDIFGESQTEILGKDLEAKILHERESGDRDPVGFEFIVQYSTMYRGDYTMPYGEVSGRAVDCDRLGIVPDSPTQWILTKEFLEHAADPLYNEAEDNFEHGQKNRIVSSKFIRKYIDYLNEYNRGKEAMGAFGYCQHKFPPTR